MRLESRRSMASALSVAVPLCCATIASAQNRVDFQLVESWKGGYNADILVEVPPGGAMLDGWTLSWSGDPEVLYHWNCTFEMDGDRTVLGNVSYNETILPGGSARLGFTGVGTWPPSPDDVRINDELVQVLIDGAGDGDEDDDDGGHDGGHDDGACCFGDLDGDMVVGGGDLALVLAGWNSDDATADLDGSGLVNGADLALLLARWGTCEHDHGDHGHDMPCMGEFIDITCWGDFHDSNHNSGHDEMVGGRTPITTEATLAYNDLRAFLGLPPLSVEDVGEWAFAEQLTNNDTAWDDDLEGVGLWYAMQGAKVGWITDEAYYPHILADIQRTARTVCNPIEMRAMVMDMVRAFGHEGYADHLEQGGMVETLINTLRMEPHYGGWMHGRCHGFLPMEGVAINHDVNHLTVLGWDQMDPFMNDTFDWRQWDAWLVSDQAVINYFQSMVVLLSLIHI